MAIAAVARVFWERSLCNRPTPRAIIVHGGTYADCGWKPKRRHDLLQLSRMETAMENGRVIGPRAVADAEAVEATHADWKHRGLTILQAPTRMSLGAAFVALDPDGHRLRVFAPQAD